MIERKKIQKRDTSKKRETILDAAAAVFVNEGYESSSMDKIAEVAGASKRTVYNHFASKEELFSEVLHRFMQEAFGLKQIAYDSAQRLEVQLGKFADAKMAISQNPSWLGLMKVTTGVFTRNPQLAQEIMSKANNEEDTLVSWLTAATKDGRLQVKKPVLAANAFWAGVGGAFFWPAIFYAPMKEKDANELKKELIELFLAKYKVD